MYLGIQLFTEPFLMTYAVENLPSVLQQNLKIVDDIVPRITNLVQSYYFQYKEASLDSFPEMVEVSFDHNNYNEAGVL